MMLNIDHTLRNTDWLHTKTWDLWHRGHLVETLDELQTVLRDISVEHFLTLPAAEAMPESLRKQIEDTVATKHLAGQHDQQTHAGGFGVGDYVHLIGTDNFGEIIEVLDDGWRRIKLEQSAQEKEWGFTPLEGAAQLEDIESGHRIKEKREKYPQPEFQEFEKGYEEWAKNLTREEFSVLQAYKQGVHYGDIQNYLRKGTRKGIAEALDPTNIIAAIDSAVDKSKAPQNFMAYRGISSADIAKKFDLLEEGSIFTDKGYASASPRSRDAERFAGAQPKKKTRLKNAVVMEIRVPEGSKVASIDAAKLFPSIFYSDESEVLFPRNAKFKVVGKSKGYAKGSAQEYKVLEVEYVSE